MQHLFAYGTLRPGGSNSDLLGHAAIAERCAVAEGLALYRNATGSFPYATPTEGRRVVGTLYTVIDHAWPALRRRLDLLEGYDPRQPDTSHYLRKRWTVRTDGRADTEAWVYLAGPRFRPRPDRLIEIGDWILRGPRT